MSRIAATMRHLGWTTTCRWGTIVALAAIVLTPLLSTPTAATFAGTNGKIALNRAGDVWVMNPNGTGATKLTTNFNAEDNPAISPDGSRIAYEFFRGIWIMNADGSGQRELTDGDPEDVDPTWSPDGTRIAFSRGGDLWVMNADGSGQVNLTQTPTLEEVDAAWSPSGNKIAYTRIGCETDDAANCVYSMNADGSSQTNLTPEEALPQCDNQPGYAHYGASREPTWSPDGSKIAFSGALICPHVFGRDIWIMNADGGGKTNLIDDESTADKRPVFSPDGTKLLFESDRDDDRLEFYVMNAANGSGLRRLTTNDDFEANADWGPAQPDCTLSVNAANAPLVGTAGNDVLCGDGRPNQLNGGGGNDVVLGFGGNDTLIASAGRDTLNGGLGVDTASFANSATPVSASLITGFARRVGSAPVEGWALSGIENLTGSAQGDTLTGSPLDNALVGGAGPDKLFGQGGADALNSRDGVNNNDTLDGGPGVDRCTTDANEASIQSCEAGKQGNGNGWTGHGDRDSRRQDG